MNIKEPAIRINAGMIQKTGPFASIFKSFPKDKILDLSGFFLLPGLVNCHSHLELPLFLGSCCSRSLPEWVLQLLKEKKKLSSADYAAAAAKNINTMLQTGTTTVAEICTQNESPDIIKQSGIRAVIFKEIISMNPLPPAPPPLLRPSSLVRTGLSPHAPHTVSERILREVKNIARRQSIPICMHVAESKDEIKLLQGKKSGFEKVYAKAGWDLAWAPKTESPFEYLYKLGLLGPRFLAVHAIQATDDDITLLRKTRTPVAHCPRSNRELGVGRMPLRKFLDAGITVGLGTDSLASSPSLSMWDEMRFAYRIHRRDSINARDIFAMATINGAKALGMEKDIGTLEPGKRADIIAVRLPEKNTGDLYSDLLRETKSSIMSMVNGKILYTAPSFPG